MLKNYSLENKGDISNNIKTFRVIIASLLSSSFGPQEFIKVRSLCRFLHNKVNEIWNYKFHKIETINNYINKTDKNNNLKIDYTDETSYKEYIKKYWKLSEEQLSYLNSVRYWQPFYNHFVYVYDKEEVKTLALIVHNGISNLVTKLKTKGNHQINYNIASDIIRKTNKYNEYELTIENPMWNNYIKPYFNGYISFKNFDSNLFCVVMYTQLYNSNMNIINEKLYNILLSKIITYGKSIGIKEVNNYVFRILKLQHNFVCPVIDEYINKKYDIIGVFPSKNLESVEVLKHDIMGFNNIEYIYIQNRDKIDMKVLFSSLISEYNLDTNVNNPNVVSDSDTSVDTRVEPTIKPVILKIGNKLDKMLITHIKNMCKNLGYCLEYNKFKCKDKKIVEKLIIEKCKKYDKFRDKIVKYLDL